MKLKLHLFDLLRISCEFVIQQVVGLVKSCGLVVDLLYNLLYTGPTAQTPLIRFVVDLLWTCCGFAVQLVVQQIYDKSNKWSLSLTPRLPASVY
jgi:hypothetical protein